MKEAQQFILSLGEEELLGEIPVILYVNSIRKKVSLSHVYDVSEGALIPLYEKYGDRNVKLEEYSSPDNVAWHLRSESQPRHDEIRQEPLERIADALESINSHLAEACDRLQGIEETLDSCICKYGNNHFLCITGNVSTH